MKKQSMSSPPIDLEETGSGHVLTFQLAAQRYGLPVTAVHQIIEIVAITHLPQMPQGIQGAINVHGRVVPVIDLRLRFGLPCMPYHLHTPLILVQAGGQLLALVVDAVQDVVEVALPAHDAPAAVQYGQELIPLVDVAHLLSPQEQQQLAQRLPAPSRRPLSSGKNGTNQSITGAAVL
ncbi:MAG: chemotaxis protein CheW [Anaerolineae bacterium]|nr:chemotaxis protein CheW [Anaerolineae bacterium]